MSERPSRSRLPLRPVVQLLPAAVLLASLSACGEFSCSFGDIDAEIVEKNITDEFASQLKVRPTKVECPEGVKQKKGEQFVCKVSLEDGTVLDVPVQMTGGGNVEWQYNAFNTAEAETTLATSIAQQTGAEIASVECPLLVELEGDGNTPFTCTVTDGKGERAPVQVTLTGEGMLDWEIAPAAQPQAEGEGAPPPP